MLRCAAGAPWWLAAAGLHQPSLPLLLPFPSVARSVYLACPVPPVLLPFLPVPLALLPSFRSTLPAPLCRLSTCNPLALSTAPLFWSSASCPPTAGLSRLWCSQAPPCHCCCMPGGHNSLTTHGSRVAAAILCPLSNCMCVEMHVGSSPAANTADVADSGCRRSARCQQLVLTGGMGTAVCAQRRERCARRSVDQRRQHVRWLHSLRTAEAAKLRTQAAMSARASRQGGPWRAERSRVCRGRQEEVTGRGRIAKEL